MITGYMLVLLVGFVLGWLFRGAWRYCNKDIKEP